jgi:hypothetical protein
MEIFAAEGAPQVLLTAVANRKNLQSEKLKIIFRHLWVVELTYRFQVHFKGTLAPD